MVPAPAARRRRNPNPAARRFPAGGQSMPPPAGPGGGRQRTDKQTERPRGGDPPAATPREGAHPAGGQDHAPTRTNPGRDRVRSALGEEASKAAGIPVRLTFRVGEPPKATPRENLQNLLKFGSQFDNIQIK